MTSSSLRTSYEHLQHRGRRLLRCSDRTRLSLWRLRRLFVEPLEARLLLAITPALLDADQALLSGDESADTLYLRINTAGFLEFSDSGGEDTYVCDLNSDTAGDQTLTITPSTRITVDLGAGDDTLVIESADLVHVDLVGGAGDDTLDVSRIDRNLVFAIDSAGAVSVSDGEYSIGDDRTVAVSGFTFTYRADAVEHLVGGRRDNVFVFEDGAAFAGTVDGGSGSGNTLDYSAYTTAVDVDLSAGRATGTRAGAGAVSRIQNVLGGLGPDVLAGNEGANILAGGPGDDTLISRGGDDLLAGDDGEDTLVGPPGDNLWEIDEANGGMLNGTTRFHGIEHLVGSADSQDGFVFLAGGSISGVIAGGDGGSDGFLVQEAVDEGPFTRVDPDHSGTGSVTIHGQTVRYAGMEPILDAAAAATVVVHGSVYNDRLVLEDAAADAAGQMQIRFASGDYFDAVAGEFRNTLVFANPRDAFILRLGGGDDSLTIGVLDPDFSAAVVFEGGAGFDTLVGPDTANSWAITDLNTGTLNTRMVFGDVEDLTGGSAGDDFLFAPGAAVEGVIDGGTGGPNRLDYSSTTAGVTVALGLHADRIDAVVGGSGSDTFIGLPGTAAWNILSVDGGRYTATDEDGQLVAEVVFEGFENLTGSTGDDVFVFADEMGVAGVIDGGGGSNVLDYSAYGLAQRHGESGQRCRQRGLLRPTCPARHGWSGSRHAPRPGLRYRVEHHRARRGRGGRGHLRRFREPDRCGSQRRRFCALSGRRSERRVGWRPGGP